MSIPNSSKAQGLKLVPADPIDQRVTYPFPLRPGMLVELRIPRTLTQADYERLCAFLLTLRDDRG